MADCNTCLPLECLVKVDIGIENVVDQAEFNCLAILTDNLTGGIGGAASPVNAGDCAKDYVTFDEVASEWDSTSDVYASAQHAFAQTPSVAIVKVMYVDFGANIQNQLNTLFECEVCQGIVAPSLRDDPRVLEIADWVEARGGSNFFFTDSNDELTLDQNDGTSMAAMFQAAAYQYSAVYYHSDIDEQFASAAMSFGLGQDLDLVGSAFTMAFNELALVAPDFVSKSELVAITGHLPATGCGPQFGKFASLYGCVGGQNMMLYGSMADGNFFDTALLREYMKARIQEGVSQVFVNGSVPQTQVGATILANNVDFILSQFEAAGWITEYTVLAPVVANSTTATRACRILECIEWDATLAGRVHSTCVLGRLNF